MSVRFSKSTDLEEIVHDYCPITDIGLDNVQEFGAVKS